MCLSLNREFAKEYLDNPKKPRWVAKPTVAYLWARTVGVQELSRDDSAPQDPMALQEGQEAGRAGDDAKGGQVRRRVLDPA